jgi:hypothetical protein
MMMPCIFCVCWEFHRPLSPLINPRWFNSSFRERRMIPEFGLYYDSGVRESRKVLRDFVADGARAGPAAVCPQSVPAKASLPDGLGSCLVNPSEFLMTATVCTFSSYLSRSQGYEPLLDNRPNTKATAAVTRKMIIATRLIVGGRRCSTKINRATTMAVPNPHATTPFISVP